MFFYLFTLKTNKVITEKHPMPHFDLFVQPIVFYYVVINRSIDNHREEGRTSFLLCYHFGTHHPYLTTFVVFALNQRPWMLFKVSDFAKIRSMERGTKGLESICVKIIQNVSSTGQDREIDAVLVEGFVLSPQYQILKSNRFEATCD